jgi:hypothetical protein
MSLQFSCVSRIESNMLSGATRLRDVSPYLHTSVCVGAGSTTTSFDILAFEWLVELRRFLSLEIFPPSEYRTSLTIGGYPFLAKVLPGQRISLHTSGSSISLDLSDIISLVECVYKSTAKLFSGEKELLSEVNEHKLLVLYAVDSFKARHAHPDQSSDPYLL